MTNDTTTTDSTPAESTTAAPEAAESPQQADTGENTPSNKEAAKYRRQLRETEAERDALREHLSTARGGMLTTLVDGLRVKSSQQLHPTAHAEVFTDPNAYFNDDGTVNEAAVTAKLEETYESHPHYFHRNLTGTGIIPNVGGTPDLPKVSRDSFKEAFAPKPY